jgi:hypothetical protein
MDGRDQESELIPKSLLWPWAHSYRHLPHINVFFGLYLISLALIKRAAKLDDFQISSDNIYGELRSGVSLV